MGSAPQKVDPLRIVAIGGGTGLSTLLRGLKEFIRADGQRGRRLPLDVTAVVTVTDDGGSSGRLRREFDVLPPGDIRNCIVALSEAEELLADLFQYRFEAGRGLKGHSFGNLLLTALTKVTGDFAHAVQFSSRILRTCGRIYPSTATNVVLEAEFSDGARVTGESRIARRRKPISLVRLVPDSCEPLPETLQALAAADLISLGPGSLFTSVIPNLLVQGIAPAIRQSAAVKAYFVNLMQQPGETLGMTAADHIRAIERHAGPGLLEYAILNTRAIAPELRRKYALQRSHPVVADTERILECGVQVIGVPLLEETDKVRHDPLAAAEILVRLAGEGRRRKLQAVRSTQSQTARRQLSA
jgi:uncharacterized cofD-like protein